MEFCLETMVGVMLILKISRPGEITAQIVIGSILSFFSLFVLMLAVINRGRFLSSDDESITTEHGFFKWPSTKSKKLILVSGTKKDWLMFITLTIKVCLLVP